MLFNWNNRILILLKYSVLLIHVAVGISPRNRPQLVSVPREARSQINIGPCTWIIDRKCPDNDVKFFLFSRMNLKDRQLIHADETLEKSNLSSSYFNAAFPTKIIIHGYNSDMFLTPLIEMKDEYLQRGEYNLIYVDWSSLAPAPCYPSAAHNTRHAGKCIAQLINRIRDAGCNNIHLIGFSLGAHVTNFAANNLNDFKLPRITGLDPAMPLFITASIHDKLDPSDASFVDVIHSNAFVQGKIERCGHVDFYMNGGILQPGCIKSGTNPIACSHHRAPDYFCESIQSNRGFYGWPCTSYINYLLGFCPRTSQIEVLAGEDCQRTMSGMFMITTNSESPFASGQWTDIPGQTKTAQNYGPGMRQPASDPFQQQIDQWGKLEGTFNNVDNSHKRFSWNSIDATVINNNNNFNDMNYLEGMLGGLRSPSDYWRINDKFSQSDNFFMQYRYNLTQNIISDDNFRTPTVIA